MTANAESLNLYWRNERTMSTAMPTKMKRFTIGISRSRGYHLGLPMISLHVTKFSPGTHACHEGFSAFLKRPVRLKQSRRYDTIRKIRISTSKYLERKYNFYRREDIVPLRSEWIQLTISSTKGGVSPFIRSHRHLHPCHSTCWLKCLKMTVENP